MSSHQKPIRDAILSSRRFTSAKRLPGDGHRKAAPSLEPNLRDVSYWRPSRTLSDARTHKPGKTVKAI